MVYRAASIGIVAFWLVMMGLLIRLETHPESTDILDVPVSYVARLMFLHGQTSLLNVSDQTKPVGTVSLKPFMTGTDGRALDFSGTLSVQLPLAAMQRVNFNGTLNLDVALRMRNFHVDMTMQDPRVPRQPKYHLILSGDTASNTLSYQMYLGNLRTSAQTLSMDASKMTPALLQGLGIDTRALPISPASVTPPSVNARETQISLHGEQLQVFQVSVIEGAEPMLDVYVTQLGQVILAKTNFGYTLASDDW